MSGNGQAAGLGGPGGAKLPAVTANPPTSAIRRWRENAAWVPGALVLAGIVLAVLGMAALGEQAERAHRSAVEAMLRGYADLAAEELVRRSSAEIGYAGYFRTLEGIGNRTNADAGATALVRQTLHRGADGDIVGSGSVPPAPLREAWSDLLRTEGRAPFRTVHLVIDGRLRSFVLGRGPGSEQVGFEVETAAVADWLGLQASRGPPLPASLASRLPDHALLYFRIEDPAGQHVLSVGEPPPLPLRAERRAGTDYGGVLEGYRIEAGIPEPYAAVLVAGGLPVSRTPAMAILALLAAVLAVLTGRLWRERHHQATQREEFVARVSHELRTPLAQIRLFAETLLLERAQHPEQKSHALRVIDREARRLSHLVDNILRFSGGRGSAAGAAVCAPLSEVVERVAGDFAPLASPAQIRIRYLEPALATRPVPEDAVHRMLLNLLDNAVRHGGGEGPVSVEVERQGEDGLRLAVCDGGPGIATAERERVFAPYYRSGQSAGTGLGLAVVRELARALGGDCRVADAAQGTRIEIDLPGGTAA